jgi:transcriptional regulator with XRE-family HTH domain
MTKEASESHLADDGDDARITDMMATQTRRMANFVVNNGEKIVELASKIGVTSTALSNFMKREDTTVRKSNLTMQGLYSYFSTTIRSFDESTLVENGINVLFFTEDQASKISASQLENDEYNAKTAKAYEHILDLFRIPISRYMVEMRSLLGDYTLYRTVSESNHGSVSKEMILKSNLSIRLKDKYTDIIEYYRSETGEFDFVNEIDGAVIPLDSYFYFIGDYEKGRGIEFIALKEPSKSNGSFFYGSIVTKSETGAIVNCNCVLLRNIDDSLFKSKIDMEKTIEDEKRRRSTDSIIYNKNIISKDNTEYFFNTFKGKADFVLRHLSLKASRI